MVGLVYKYKARCNLSRFSIGSQLITFMNVPTTKKPDSKTTGIWLRRRVMTIRFPIIAAGGSTLRGAANHTFIKHFSQSYFGYLFSAHM
jgi:hypothetical protein